MMASMTDEEVKQAVDEIAVDIRGQIEELKEQQKKQADEIQEKIDEISKSILGDRPLEPLNTPQRWPSDNVDKQVEWIKSEFTQMVKEIEEEKESMERFEKELDQECEEIMEDMARRGEKLNKEIQEVRDLHQQVEAELNEKLKKFREDMLAINRPLEELLSQLRELRDSDRKLNEESFDRYLETERVIEAMEEAIETETYELKIEKSYKSGLVPEWTHPSLSKVSYTVTPVYRTIEGFQEKIKNNERIITEPFYTTHGGYKMALVVCPNGDGRDKGSHVSVYIRLMKGDNDNVLPFPFTGNVIIEALKWSEDDGHVENIISFDESLPLEDRQRVTDKDAAENGWGWGGFLSHLDLQQYLLNDMICLRVSFEGKLVDTTKPLRTMHQKPKRGQMQMKIRRDREKREERKMGGRQQMTMREAREKERHSKRNFRTYYDRNPPQLRPRAPSVDVKASWKVVREIAFPELVKLNYSPGKPQDLYMCGSVGYHDVRKEKSVSVKFPQKLARNDKVFHTVSTTRDPIIQRLAKKERDTCKVFATDAILATLMTCTRSRYSWDIVVNRVSDCLFFDKRDDSKFEYLSVDETAKEPPQLEEGINSPQRLAVEATYINQALSQQLLMQTSTLDLKEPNPFAENEDETASVVYRYRKYTLSDGHGLVVRCAHDSVLPPTTKGESANQFINIKALNEWDPKYSGGNHVDWRMNLDRQRGAVFATELKNNSCKISKWTISSILAGSEYIKFGYVSRVSPRDADSHNILGIQTERPVKLATQLGLDINNAWGILHAIIDYCRELPIGKYLIMKDPNKPVMRIYEIPDDEFESSDSEGEESDGYQSNENKSD